MKVDLNTLIKIDYEKYYELFSRIEPIKDSIVFLGDSIINYLKLEDYYSNDNLINMGIPGDTTEGVLNRLDQVIRLNPKIIIISIGSNDLVRIDDGNENIIKRILEIKYKLEESLPDTIVHLLTLAPVLRDHAITNVNYMKHRTNDDIMEINDELLIYTNYIIDTNGCLADEYGDLKLEYTTDGLHLTKAGYYRFTKIISHTVKELNFVGDN